MKSKNQLIVKSNKLLEAGYSLSLQEQRLILSAIAQIDSRPNAQITLTSQLQFEISALDFSHQLGIDTRNLYRDLKKITKNLYERSVVIHDPDPSNPYKEVYTRWVSAIAYAEKEGLIRLTFAPDIIPYLSQLSGKFKGYKLEFVASMKSTYGIRLYELLVQWQSKGFREVEINWLRKLFKIEHKYTAMCDFKKRVIDPGISDINNYSNLWVRYSQRKTGRRITHLQFQFGLKSEQKKNGITAKEWANLPENRQKTIGKTLPEIKKMMSKN